jgi:ribosomal-protein-alanine N-acetyltransferase
LLDLNAFLKSLNCQNVFLEVRIGNAGALSLYRSVGFAESGIRKHYYADTGEDAQLMRWDLSS